MYNHAQYLEQCLDSIYSDDYPNIELIIIDDGSKDNSLEVAKKWRESHPDRFQRFHLETQENLGICRTLNRLISLAGGEYVLPLASDDYFLSGGIEAKVRALKARPDWLAVCGDAILVNPEGKVLSESAIETSKVNRFALLKDHLRQGEIIFNWAVPLQIMAFRKEAFSNQKGVGLYNENLLVEDRDMCLRLLAKNAYGFTNDIAYAYRVRAAELSKSKPRNINATTPGLDQSLRIKHLAESGANYYSGFRGINKAYLYIDGYFSEGLLKKIIIKFIRYLYKIKIHDSVM